MDTSKAVTHVSLCAGYGGIDLGLSRAIPSLRTVAFSEIEAFACANLVAKMEAGLLDAAPIWTNLKTFPWAEFRGRVDILSGGYPCQPFSAAGKRLGTDDPRHLWPYIANGIRIMRPKLCFFENVEGHISLGLRAVIEELGSIGYQVSWGIFSARQVGAPHQRKRIFIMAHLLGARLEGVLFGGKSKIETEEFIAGCSSELADSTNQRQKWGGIFESTATSSAVTRCRNGFWPSRPSEPQHEWEPPRVVGNAAKHDERHPQERDRTFGLEQPSQRQAQSPMGGNSYGPAGGLDYAELCISGDNRTDELRLLGNGVVPATATKAFLTLINEIK